MSNSRKSSYPPWDPMRVDTAVDACGARRVAASLCYLNQFLALECAPDLLAAKVLPLHKAAKEVAEIMSMYSAVRRFLQDSLGDPGVVLLDVGCGVAPRAAAMFALRSRWDCHGVDPKLSRQAVGLKRVTGHAEGIQEHLARPEVAARLRRASAVVAINVHGHALLDYLDRIDNPETWVFAMPCCVALEAPSDFRELDRWVDWKVPSEKRELIAWSRRAYAIEGLSDG